MEAAGGAVAKRLVPAWAWSPCSPSCSWSCAGAADPPLVQPLLRRTAVAAPIASAPECRAVTSTGGATSGGGAHRISPARLASITGRRRPCRAPPCRRREQPVLPYSAVPARQGLYDPAAERDACGLALVVDVKGRRSHRHGRAGADRAAQPAAPRRRRRRAELRRRLRPAHAGPGRLSTGRSPASRCRRRGRTRPASSSPRPSEAAARARGGRRGSPPRSGWPCSAGGSCRSTRPASARPRCRCRRASGRSSSPPPRATR